MRTPSTTRHTLTRALPSTLLASKRAGARPLSYGVLPAGLAIRWEHHESLPADIAPYVTTEIVQDTAGRRYRVERADLECSI